MAFAKRVYNDFKDERGTQWHIEIEDESGTPATELTGARNIVEIRWNGSDYKRIVGSEMIVTFVTDEDLSWLNTSERRTIRATLKKNANTYFQGYLVTGEFVESLNADPREYSFIANDGLGLLREEDYVDGSGYPFDDFEDEITILAQALQLTGLQLPIRCAVNLFEDSMNDTDSDDPLKQTSIDQFAFTDEDYNPGKCYDVINKILTTWKARIFQASGYWMIMPYEDMDGTAIDYRDFNYDGTYNSNNSYDPTKTTNKTNFINVKGSITQTNPALKQVTITQDFKKRPSILKGSNFPENEFITDTTFHHWGILLASPISRHYVDGKPGLLLQDNGNGGTINLIKGISHFGQDMTAMPTGSFLNLRIIATVLDGPTNVFFRLSYDIGGGTIYYWTGALWTTSPSNISGITIPVTDSPSETTEIIERVTGLAIDGTMSLTIYNPSDIAATGKLFVKEVFLEENGRHNYPASAEDVTIIDVDNSMEAEYVNEFTDLPETGYGLWSIYAGLIKVNTDSSYPSTWYKKGTPGTTKSLIEWLVAEASDNASPTLMYNGKIKGLADYFNTIELIQAGSAKFIWGDVTYKIKEATWTGTAYEIKGMMLDSKISTPASSKRAGSGIGPGPVNVRTLPGDPDQAVQYNDGGAFAGDTNMQWDGDNLLLGAGKNYQIGGSDLLSDEATAGTTPANWQAEDIHGATQAAIEAFIVANTASGSGTTDTLAKWTGSGTLGDSIASESGTVLGVAGSIEMTLAESRLVFTGQCSDYPSGGELSSIYMTDDDGGAYPFDSVGNLVLQSRQGSVRDIVFVTGNPAANRMIIGSTGLITIGTFGTSAGNFITHDSGVLQERTAAEVRTDLNVADGADVTGDNAPQAHKDSHDPEDGSDALDTANAAEIAGVQAAGTGTSHSFARADHAHQIQHGITDNHLVTIDSASVADNDYAKFTADGLEGKSYVEVKTDLSLDNVENTALSTWAGTTNITTLGTIAAGTWNGDTIAIGYGGTGQTTAQAAIDALTQVSGATNEHVLTKDTGSGNAIWKAVAGGGGTVGGTGTEDTLAKWSAGGADIEDSIASESGTVLSVANTVNIAEEGSYTQDGEQVVKIHKGGHPTDYTNVYVGAGAGSDQITQTAIGNEAGSGSTGNSQVAIGYRAGKNNTGDGQTAIGKQAGENNTGDNQFAFGQTSGYGNSGDKQFALGISSGYNNTGNNQVAIGYFAGYANTVAGCTQVGYYAGYTNSGINSTQYGYFAGFQNTGSYQTTMGYYAGRGNTATNNTSIGYYAGYTNSGTYSTQIGYEAGHANSGAGQTVIGRQAGKSNATNYQTALGYRGGYTQTGANQTALGAFAGGSNSGISQITIGYDSGVSNSGANVISIGYQAGKSNTGDRITAIGYESCETATADDIIAIGYQAGKSGSTANQLIINQANLNATPIIQGDLSSLALTFGGTVNIATVANEGTTSTKVLTLDASNNVDYRTPAEILSDAGGAMVYPGAGIAVSTGSAWDTSLSTGIADTNVVVIDDADAADNDYAKFTATGLEGRSYSEVKTDLSLDNVENTALSTWVGSANITTVGTIGTGTWEGTAIADAYIASSATWDAKQDALTFGIADTNAVQIDGTATADYLAKFTSSGIVNSQIQDDGTTVGVGFAPDATIMLNVNNAAGAQYATKILNAANINYPYALWVSTSGNCINGRAAYFTSNGAASGTNRAAVFTAYNGATNYAIETDQGYIKVGSFDTGSGNFVVESGGILGSRTATDALSDLGAIGDTEKADLTEATSSVLTITGGTDAVLGSGTTIEVDQADDSNDGYLSSADFNKFNTRSETLTIVNPGSSEDRTIMYTTQQITVTKVHAVVVGSSTPSVTISVGHASSRNGTVANFMTGWAITSVTTAQTDSTLVNTGVAAGKFIVVKSTAQSGTVNELMVTIEYTID